jgi:hypothetical protein
MRARPLLVSVTAFLLVLANALIAADLVGPEFSVTPPDSSPWPVGYRWTPQVATNGETYLAVWTDARAGGGDIYITTLTAAGEVIDRSGTRIALGSSPKVVWNGRYFLITFLVRGCEIFITRVSAEGELIDLTPSRLASYPMNACPREFAMTTNSRQSLVVINNARGSEAILLSQEGERGDTLYLTKYIWYSAAVASDGRDFLAVVHEGTGRAVDIRSIRIDPTGIQHSGAVIATGIDPPRLRLAWNGKEYALLLETDNGISGRLIDPSGLPVGEQVEVVTDFRIIFRSEIVWNGDSFTVAYSSLLSPLRVFTFDFKSRGHIATLAPVQRDVHFGIASAGNGRTLVLWSFRSYESHLTAVTFNSSSLRSSGVPERQELIGVTPPAQFYPDIVHTPRGFAITWLERVSASELGVHLIGTSAAGELFREPILLGTTIDERPPRIAFDGALVVVWWQTSQGLMIARLTPALEPIDSALLPARFKDVFPADGRLLAFGNEYRAPTHVTLAQIFRTSDLTPLSSEIQFPWPARFAAAGWNGQSFLLAWRQGVATSGPVVTTVPPSNPPAQIVAARLSANGFLLDPVPIPIAMQPRHHRDISIASNGDGFIVVWAESAPYRDGPYDILGRAVSADGIAHGGFPDSNGARIATSVLSERSTVVRPLGSDYLVGWVAHDQSSRQSSVQFFRVASDVSPLTSVTTAGVIEPDPHSHVRFAADGETILMTYSRVAVDSEHRGVARVFFRRLLGFVPIRQRPVGIREDDS